MSPLSKWVHTAHDFTIRCRAGCWLAANHSCKAAVAHWLVHKNFPLARTMTSNCAIVTWETFLDMRNYGIWSVFIVFETSTFVCIAVKKWG